MDKNSGPALEDRQKCTYQFTPVRANGAPEFNEPRPARITGVDICGRPANNKRAAKQPRMRRQHPAGTVSHGSLRLCQAPLSPTIGTVASPSNPSLSPRMRELIRHTARIALNPTQQWLDELDRTTLAANPALSDDPALVEIISRANRANLIHFAVAILRDPGGPVPANFGPEPLRMAQELLNRGLEALAADIYRIAHNVAWERWTDIAFGLTSNPQELRDLLDVAFRSSNDFIDATIAGIPAQLPLEYDALTREVSAQRRKVVEQILGGAPVNRERAEAQLGYLLDRAHTAAIVWSDEPDGDHGQLDQAADAFCTALGCRAPLIVVTNSATRWVWVNDAATPVGDRIQQVLTYAPTVRLAVGNTRRGIEGFRRSHRDAQTTQRMLTRLGAPQRTAHFADTQMVELLTQDLEGVDEFIECTLGEFQSASPVLHAILLTYINQQCNAARTAKALYIHRNTLVHRLETAHRLLPQPVEANIVRIAVALEVLQWRSDRDDDSLRAIT